MQVICKTAQFSLFCLIGFPTLVAVLEELLEGLRWDPVSGSVVPFFLRVVFVPASHSVLLRLVRGLLSSFLCVSLSGDVMRSQFHRLKHQY
jgi:hypothetical protein